jgi:hypothetical protein
MFSPLPSRTRSRRFGALTLVLCSCLGAVSCQGYAFDLRLPQRAQGQKVVQKVATLVPADILFVIDNSGSMLNQRRELIANMGAFIAQMSQSNNDFHLGIVTTDVECNIPERDCSQTDSHVSPACCRLVESGKLPTCQDVDTDGDGHLDWSNCDGGRLRAPQGQLAYFTRPQGDPNAWTAAVASTIEGLGCNGSGYESGLEAARRAVECALGTPQCPSAAAAERNAGFLRAEADLVVVFVTDEDDCSFRDPNTYLPPADASDAAQQAAHLCNAAECYAYYGAGRDADGDGLQDWADPSLYAQDGGTAPLYCGSSTSRVDRVVNPPYPDATADFLTALVAAKGGDVGRVRAAGIVSAVADGTADLGFRGDACVNLGVSAKSPLGLGVTNACGCWSASVVAQTPGTHDPYCALTDAVTGLATPTPVNQVSNECSSVGTGAAAGPDDLNALAAPQPGCKAMPAGRYVEFLRSLSAQRLAQSYASNTLIDSICNASYAETFYGIVNTVILTNCFSLGTVPAAAADIDVRRNGHSLDAVAVGSMAPGYSWRQGSSQICLEGGLRKALGDQFEIFVLQPS